MKKIILLLSFQLVTLMSIAQITVSKDTVEYLGFKKYDPFHCHSSVNITNTNTTDTITVEWQKTGDNFLSGWNGAGIDDKSASYPYNNTQQFFKLLPGEIGYLFVTMNSTITGDDGCSFSTITFTESGTVGSKNVVFKYCTWPTAVNDLNENNFAKVYPNPATDFVNIALYDKKITSINVVNVIGKRIAKFNVDATKNDNIKVPLDKVANGIYLLQFADLNGKVLGVRRVTKQ